MTGSVSYLLPIRREESQPPVELSRYLRWTSEHATLIVVDGSPPEIFDGDVLFENLELVRTFQVAGARVVDRPDLYVRRLPPTAQRFWSQRVRQAYDDLAEPSRLARHLAIVPAIALLAHRPRRLLVAAAGVVAMAEIGRRRAGGTHVFSVPTSFLSLGWVVERGVCSWIALAWRLGRGGCPYAGSTIVRAATPVRELRLRVEGSYRLGGTRLSRVGPVA